MNSNNSSVRNDCSDPDGSLIAGWYGKIPYLGDFISRRLPTRFIDTWDSWLQHAMAASRAELGEHWLDAYLTGPIWRFTLMPGICGDTTSMWAGVLMPSVDKVGRYFPLTIALRIDPRPGSMLTVFSAQAWYAALERVALATLNINALPDDLDRNLSENPFPLLEPGGQRGNAQELAVWWTGEHTPKALTLPTENALADLFDTTAEDLLTSTSAGKSFWWAVSTEVGTTQLHCFSGLPPEDYFATMLENNISARMPRLSES
ncbi:type VI secretion system-associated protein TagF [Nitrosospira sp. Nsp13]|uniref:type VI secretion system-associated protein TagF n=1 Tax=Nitrosospira sp. Nsp13 TaxID=1855332 RepID=UPI0008804A9F|nr:type VI secretion system-associated protein TagF [Nitrosospira sp. Nsp13]SCX78068.1 type VI secretion system protein ImpM [Nitrosospira sp. Nsp13]